MVRILVRVLVWHLGGCLRSVCSGFASDSSKLSGKSYNLCIARWKTFTARATELKAMPWRDVSGVTRVLINAGFFPDRKLCICFWQTLMTFLQAKAVCLLQAKSCVFAPGKKPCVCSWQKAVYLLLVKSDVFSPGRDMARVGWWSRCGQVTP